MKAFPPLAQARNQEAGARAPVGSLEAGEAGETLPPARRVLIAPTTPTPPTLHPPPPSGPPPTASLPPHPLPACGPPPQPSTAPPPPASMTPTPQPRTPSGRPLKSNNRWDITTRPAPQMSQFTRAPSTPHRLHRWRVQSLWLGDPLEWLLLVSRERDLSSYLLWSDSFCREPRGCGCEVLSRLLGC